MGTTWGEFRKSPKLSPEEETEIQKEVDAVNGVVIARDLRGHKWLNIYKDDLCKKCRLKSEKRVLMPGICNVCGTEFDLWDEIEGNEISMRRMYGSKYDGDDICIKICIECLDDIVDRCEVSPLCNTEIDDLMRKT